MTKPNPLTEQEKADLVAYLDGELQGEAARAMETQVEPRPDGPRRGRGAQTDLGPARLPAAAGAVA